MISKLLVKKIFKNVLLLIGTVSMLFLSLEFIFRLTAKDYQIRSKLTRHFQRDEIMINALKPNSRGVWIKEQFSTIISINSLGFRDDERKLEKSPDTYRIMLLGDSFTFGLGVNMEETYAKVLEHMLNESAKDEKYEVFNLAVPGNSTDQEYLFLKEKSRKFQADLAVVAFCPNDIVDLFSYIWVEDEQGLPQKLILPYKVPDFPLRRFLQEHSFFYNCMSYRLTMFRNKMRTKAEASRPEGAAAISSYYRKPYSTQLQDKLAKIFQIYKEMDKICEARGVEFQVLLLPYKELAAKDYFIKAAGKKQGEEVFRLAWPLSLIEEFCQKENIGVVNTLPVFRTREHPKELFIPNDGHLSVQGHLTVAQVLYDDLLKRERLGYLR